jgi:hypothetical protein
MSQECKVVEANISVNKKEYVFTDDFGISTTEGLKFEDFDEKFGVIFFFM